MNVNNKKNPMTLEDFFNAVNQDSDYKYCSCCKKINTRIFHKNGSSTNKTNHN